MVWCRNEFKKLGISKIVLNYSLGMNKNNKEIQLNSLHLHGVMGMTTKDIIDYFDQYNPKFLEWVSNSECRSIVLWNIPMISFKIVYLTFLGNVVWLDDRIPTKALLDMTRPIRELRHITSVVDHVLHKEDETLNENTNDDYMEQDDVNYFILNVVKLIYYKHVI